MKPNKIRPARYSQKRNHRLLAVALVTGTMTMSSCRDLEPGRPGDDVVAQIDSALEAASNFLTDQQAGDGAWRLEASSLNDGYAVTPLVLRALHAAGKGHGETFDHGVAFAATIVDGDGEMSGKFTETRYSVSAAAGTLQLSYEVGGDVLQRLEVPLAEYLIAAQFSEANGFSPDDPEFGGWGYQSARPRTEPSELVDPEVDLPNLSATLFAVEALLASRDEKARRALARAGRFIERCQNFSPQDHSGDGGFIYSPAAEDLNKAGPDDSTPTGFRSYGTMTANGIRLLSSLKSTDHPRYLAAVRWLETRFRADATPGEFPPDRQTDAQSVYFYYVWTAAEALHGISQPVLDTDRGTVDWRAALAEELLGRQLPDGPWKNQAEKRSEAAIVATPLAMMSLAESRADIQR